MSDEERTAEARALAEESLGRLLAEAAPESAQLIVLGGLVPPTLTGVGPSVPQHLGTADVDLLLVTHVTASRDLGSIERGLLAMAFTPEPDGWRWRGGVRGHATKIEFLCDLDTARSQELIRPEGCEQLHALNLRGTGSVAIDPRNWSFPHSGGMASVKIAGLGGYVLAKIAALHARAARKDYYDLVYVLLYNDQGGPMAAAHAINGDTGLSTAARAMRGTITDVRSRYHDDRSYGSIVYAEEAIKVELTADKKFLAADATAAVNEFISGLAVLQG